MRIGIASHIVLDTIRGADGTLTESLGGPPCYCGLTSRRFSFEVELATRVGRDFPAEKRNLLQNNGIKIKDEHIADAPTTRFSLLVDRASRKLVLHSKCAPLTEDDVRKTKVDCWLASPVIDEVPVSVLAAIVRNKGRLVMLDPQGYMRSVDQNGRIILADRLALDLSGTDAIKVDQVEMAALTGGLQGIEGMKMLQSRGVEFVVSTEHRVIHLLHRKTHYWIKMKEIDAPDSTGSGDILSAAFCCAYLKEKDPLWALCFGVGAVRAALETKQAGLAKVPPISKIEQSASYYYNTIAFQNL